MKVKVALLCTAWAACTSGPTPRPSPDGNRSGPDLRILFTTDVSGYLEPCGCQSRPLGGIDRMAVVLGEGRRTARATLFVAAGSTLFKTATLEASEVAQDRIKAETLVEILRRLDLDAVAPGPADLALGADELRRIVSPGGFALVAANASDRGAFAAELVRPSHGVQVGIFGVADLGAASGDPVAAARLSVGRLSRQGARIVVGLASVGRRTAARIAREVPGIDFLVVGGARAYPALPPEKVGDTHLLFGGRDGHGLGVVDLTLREDDPRFVDVGTQAASVAIERLDRRIADLETRIHTWQRQGGATAAELREMRERLDGMRRERTEVARRRAPSDRSSFVSRWEELGPERRRDPAVTALIDAHDRRVAEVNRAALAGERPLPPVPGRATYRGGAVCATCHEDAVTFWRTTPHSRAFETLANDGKELDLHCVGCHVTGYRQPGGSTALVNETLRDVQCEVCHGPGSGHVDAEGYEDTATIVRMTPEATCLPCHNEEHSDHFNYRNYLPRILGPGHGQPLPAKTQ